MTQVDAGPVLVTQAEYARLRGVSRQAISKLCRAPGGGEPAGRLYGTAALLNDGRINVAMADAVLGPAVPRNAGARGASGEGTDRQGRGAAAASRDAMADGLADAPPAGVLSVGPSAAAIAAAMGNRILGDKERRERALADQAEMAAAKERRDLVAVDAVADPQFDVVRIMRNRVLAVPEAFGEELAAIVDPRALSARLLDLLEDALRDAAHDLAAQEREEQAEVERLEAELAGEGAG